MQEEEEKKNQNRPHKKFQRVFRKLKKKTHQTYYILVNIMAAEMRAMLDQLMGAERDVPLDERVNRKKLFTVNECYY